MRCNLILASCTLQEYSVVVNLAILCREKPAGVGTERRQRGVWCCRSGVPCLISSVAAPDSSRSEAYSTIWMREHNCLTSRNHTHALYPVLEEVNENGRQLRFQGLYAYRRRFGMQPFTSFLDLAGDPKLAADLEHFCRDIEAVEYYVSLVTARLGPSVTLPSTNENVAFTVSPWYVLSFRGCVRVHSCYGCVFRSSQPILVHPESLNVGKKNSSNLTCPSLQVTEASAASAPLSGMEGLGKGRRAPAAAPDWPADPP
ncbi:hypothetical protein O3P69_015671 [Scylla paramamosain]|uniref:Uncharacterized protein n=1 Tax=Scylla paramamosain TaxID=85552 RepID=A0AAW0SIH1_SCYPA